MTPSQIQRLLTESSVVLETTPAVQNILQIVADRIAAGKPLTIMYGETYDTYGPTLDSLKYYFEVARLGEALRNIAQSPRDIAPNILIADVAACRNAPADEHADLMAKGKEQADFVKRVSIAYSLNLSVRLMSEYLFSTEFQHRLDRVKAEASRCPDVFRWVRQTVPDSKVAIEEEKGFAYAFEEIATIIEYDLKVGPPREKFYDEPARMIAQVIGEHPLASVYLHPTYPLGLGIAFFFNNEEIERYGVTAYKAGSKGLADHRIILGTTSPDDVRRLIESSPASKNPSVPNAVIDVAVIAEMGRQALAGELRPITIREDLAAGRLSPADLKHRAVDDLSKFILAPLKTTQQRASA